MFEEIRSRYSDDIELMGVLDEFESFIKSPVYESVKTAKAVLVVIQESLNEVKHIDLDSESRDVERIKMLMDLLISKSVEISDIQKKYSIAEEENTMSYSDKAASLKRKSLNAR